MKFKSHTILTASVLSIILVSAAGANAATWHIQNFVQNGQISTGFYDFTDGQFTKNQLVNYQGTNYLDFQWITKTSGTVPNNILGLFFANYHGNAPTVNTVNHTIDLSGLFWLGISPVANTGTGYNEGWIYDNFIGWGLQPVEWGCTDYSISGCATYYWVNYSNVPYIVNLDGTYTATWTAADTLVGTTYSMSMTFYNPATVPVPTAIWLLSSGLIGLLGVARKYKKT